MAGAISEGARFNDSDSDVTWVTPQAQTVATTTVNKKAFPCWIHDEIGADACGFANPLLVG
jgi:hypothetical protein